jgi:hypothetical protein
MSDNDDNNDLGPLGNTTTTTTNSTSTSLKGSGSHFELPSTELEWYKGIGCVI